MALPIIGAGNQRLDPENILRNLIPAAKEFFDRSQKVESLYFVEINEKYASICSKIMDEILVRHQILIPHSQLLTSITGDVTNKIFEASDLFEPEYTQLRDDWLRLCHSKEVHFFELGVLSRKLVEILIKKFGVTSSNLYGAIDKLRRTGMVAPWICGYMNILRQIGNEQAHSGDPVSRIPPFVEEDDLALTLMCVQSLLEFWIEYKLKTE